MSRLNDLRNELQCLKSEAVETEETHRTQMNALFKHKNDMEQQLCLPMTNISHVTASIVTEDKLNPAAESQMTWLQRRREANLLKALIRLQRAHNQRQRIRHRSEQLCMEEEICDLEHQIRMDVSKRTP